MYERANKGGDSGTGKKKGIEASEIGSLESRCSGEGTLEKYEVYFQGSYCSPDRGPLARIQSVSFRLL